MGFQIKVEDVMTGIVDQILDRSGKSIQRFEYTNGSYAIRQPGISFSLDLRLSVHTKEIDVQRSTNLFFMFCGGTSVFWVEADYFNDDERWFNPSEVPLDRWHNSSNHDSCWRSDGMNQVWKTFISMANSINEELKANGMEEIPPSRMNQYVTFGFCDMFKRVMIEHTAKDPSDSYFRKITKVEMTE